MVRSTGLSIGGAGVATGLGLGCLCGCLLAFGAGVSVPGDLCIEDADGKALPGLHELSLAEADRDSAGSAFAQRVLWRDMLRQGFCELQEQQRS